MTPTGAGRRRAASTRRRRRRSTTAPTYRVVANSFLSDGGDSFAEFKNGDQQVLRRARHRRLADVPDAPTSAVHPGATPTPDLGHRLTDQRRRRVCPVLSTGHAPPFVSCERRGAALRPRRTSAAVSRGAVGDEAVADVADRADQRLVLAAELGAQPAHVDVDGAGAAEVVVAPDLLEQLRAGEDAARVLGQELHQLELLVGEVEVWPRDPGGVGRLVDDDLAGADRAALLGPCRGSRAGRSRAAAGRRPRRVRRCPA